MVRLPPVGRLIPIGDESNEGGQPPSPEMSPMRVVSSTLTRDEPNEGGVIRKLQEFDRLVTGGAAVGLQGEEQRGKRSLVPT